MTGRFSAAVKLGNSIVYSREEIVDEIGECDPWHHEAEPDPDLVRGLLDITAATLAIRVEKARRVIDGASSTPIGDCVDPAKTSANTAIPSDSPNAGGDRP